MHLATFAYAPRFELGACNMRELDAKRLRLDYAPPLYQWHEGQTHGLSVPDASKAGGPDDLPYVVFSDEGGVCNLAFIKQAHKTFYLRRNAAFSILLRAALER